MMKKFLIILVAIAVLAPATAYAYSFSDIFSFSRFFFHQAAQPKPAEVKNEPAVAAPLFSGATAARKYQIWLEAFSKNDLAAVISDSRNLYFTEAEINYLIARESASSTNPAVRDVQVVFTDNLAKISGYSLIKNFSGQFYLEAKPAVVNGRAGFQVTKARFHNFYFPAFIAQNLLAGQLKDAIAFLYSDKDHQTLTLAVGSGFVELSYGK